VLCVFLTEPVWIIKTRMLLNTDERISGLSNFNKSIREIHHQYGLKGFYRGLLPNIMLSFNGVVQMQTYEAMKALYLYM
jgi:solute carrier family 25 folate transporter 32